jgi:protease-4
LKKILRITGSIFLWTWRILATGTALVSTFFMLFTIGMVLVLLGQQSDVKIPDGSALVLAPYGAVLEKRSPLDPIPQLVNFINGTPRPAELLLQDIISGIRAAADDDRIKLLVLAPDRMKHAGLDQLRDIGEAIDAFKKSGKVVIAYADTFSQGQYYLASRSDEIYLNPMGSVNMRGFGVFQLYLRDLLDKLSINFHVFRVGTYKSAVEPFIRNDMSPEAKEATLQWLTRIWRHFCDDIAEQRGISAQDINDMVNQLPENLKAAGGDSAQMALNTSLIDGIKTRDGFREYMKTLVGSNDKNTSFKQVDFNDYLTTITPAYSSPITQQDRVAVVVAQGNIIYGDADVEQISSSRLTKVLRKARRDKKVKAVVLRIDSGGGSAFASEMIRQEVGLLRRAGKPVVVSMGAFAASGAYWIAADADKILASASTVTGSIGIFGAFPTFEKTLADAGVFNDGIGTTKLAGTGSLTRPMSEEFRVAVQANIEQGYRRFIAIVADGRGMEASEVEKIAQGRVWDGATALELGLVDQLGGLDDAVAVAAEMVGLPADRAAYFQEDKNPAELLLRRLEESAAVGTALSGIMSGIVSGTMSNSGFRATADWLTRRFATQYAFLPTSDPQHMYSHCLLPFSAF